jgi:TolB-like protein/AraC-like DNA-binding protein
VNRDRQFEAYGQPLPAQIPRDVKCAVDFMRLRLCDRISLADIVEHCGISERTLNDHFRKFVGRSPMRHLRSLRMAAIREALLSGSSPRLVTELAQQYRFEHFGRFADQYRKQFGELPSATLGRTRARSQSGGNRSPKVQSCFAPTREIPSLAVILGSASAGVRQAPEFMEGLAEAIAAALCSDRSLSIKLPKHVAAAGRDPRRLAREMGARYLLTGSLYCEGEHLRIVLQVADVSAGNHLWGDSFDGGMDRQFDLQARIVARLRHQIASSIRDAQIDRAFRTATADLDAHGLAMRSLPLLFSSTPEGARNALEHLSRAIQIDPDFGLAIALAAWAHGQLVMYNATSMPEEENAMARQLALRAAALGQDDPLSLTALCAVHMMFGELDVSRSLIARSLSRNPASAWAWGRSGWLQSYQGNSGGAIEHFRRALQLNPAGSVGNLYAGIGSAHFNAGRYGAAIAWIRRAMEVQPGIRWANRSLSVSYARLGDRQRALASLDTLRRSQPGLTVGQVLSSVPFRPDFLNRLGEGLSSLGLPD